MKKIEHALQELVRTVLGIALTNSIIDSLVVFLIFLFIFNVTMVKWYYSFIPFVLYFIFNCYFTVRSARINYIEKKLPFLNEQLRTVSDNVSKENDIINALNEDVLQKMRDIKNSYFIKFGKITGRVLTMVIFSFLIIFASAYNFHLFDFNKVVNNLRTGKPLGGAYNVDASNLTYEIVEDESIFGNKSVAELGYQDLKLQISPADTDIDISNVKEPEKKDFKSYAAKEIFATTDASYEENIPKNYHKIVKSYFTQISKEE